MIEFAKITGEMEGNNLQVQMKTGECLYAPMIIVGNSTSLPSDEWIKSNKDSFLALITYEGDTYYDPMVLGFYPVKGSNSEAYDVTERVLEQLIILVEKLYTARVNTQLGPQTFMPNTLVYLDNIYESLLDVQDTILKNKK